MKRIAMILITVLLCVQILLPITVSAERFYLGGTDMSLSVDDEYWYVFTRDNIKNNSQLDKLGITYEYMTEIFSDSDAYMDAFMFFNDEENNVVELFVRKVDDAFDAVDLSDYSDEEVLEFAESLTQYVSYSDSSVYKSKYKFAELRSFEPVEKLYMYQFFTVANKDLYNLQFHSTTQLNDSQYKEITSIVDSVEFNIDKSIKKPKSGFWMEVLLRGLRGAAIGAVVSVGAAAVGKAVKKRSEKKAKDGINNTDVR